MECIVALWDNYFCHEQLRKPCNDCSFCHESKTSYNDILQRHCALMTPLREFAVLLQMFWKGHKLCGVDTGNLLWDPSLLWFNHNFSAHHQGQYWSMDVCEAVWRWMWRFWSVMKGDCFDGAIIFTIMVAVNWRNVMGSLRRPISAVMDPKSLSIPPNARMTLSSHFCIRFISASFVQNVLDWGAMS